MGEINALTWLLASYIWNFPVLWNWRKALKKPIVLVSESKAVVEEFITGVCPQAMRIYGVDGIPKMNKILADAQRLNCPAIFLQLGRHAAGNVKELGKIELITNLAAEQRFEGGDLQIPFFVTCDRIVPDDVLDEMVIVDMPLEPTTEYTDFEKWIPDFADFDEILEHISKLDPEESVETSLAAAALMLAPKLKRAGKSDWAADLLACASQTAMDAEGIDYEEKIVQDFSEYLLEIGEAGFFDDVIPLPNVESEICRDMNKHMFVKGHQLYIPERRFAEICRQFSDEISLSYLKKVLKNTGILQCSSGEYTTKMTFINYAGARQRTRMICIDAEKICSEDETIKLEYILD